MPAKHIVIIGGGAAGFFAAINCAEQHPDYQITILEKSARLLDKVKISGGGRCNVTNACFDPRELIKNYPRGEKELLGPFTKFNPKNTIEWFEKRGVKIKGEEDARMFPITDSSQTIVDCLIHETKKHHITIKETTGVEDLIPPTADNDNWMVVTNRTYSISADAVIVTTGSASRMWSILEKLGHKIIPSAPSLFTFNINDPRIKGLEGLSVPKASIEIIEAPEIKSTGPLLITHWGMSGPAILKLSAWGARKLQALNYKYHIKVSWLSSPPQQIISNLKQLKQQHPKKAIVGTPQFDIPRRLWERLCIASQIDVQTKYADINNKQLEALAQQLGASVYNVTGKSTFKDEFVTAGGVALNEVDFKTMQSKKLPGLYFAGEVLDIDAITGGFNFQAAWTTGWLAGSSA